MPVFLDGDDKNQTPETENQQTTTADNANATTANVNATNNTAGGQQINQAMAQAWANAQAKQQQQPPQPQQIPPVQNQPQQNVNMNQGVKMDTNPLYTHQTIVNALFNKKMSETTGEELIRDLKLLFGNQTSINQVDERTASIYKSLEEIRSKYGDGASDTSIKYLTAPAEKLQLPYSGVIICKLMVTDNGNKIVVGTHLLIVETNQPLHPRKREIQGVQFSVPVTSGELYSHACEAAVGEIVANHYKSNLSNKNLEIHHEPCCYTVIPHEVDITDDATIAKIANHATQAILTTLDIHSGDICGKHGTFIAQAIGSKQLGNYVNVVNQPNHQIEDLTGMPIRADWTLESTIVNRSNQQNDNYGYSANYQLSLGKIAVFNQPRYAQPEFTYNQLTGQQQTVRSQHYYNEIVIKEVMSGPQTRLTLSSLLLLVASATVLTQNGSWKLAYTPNKSIPYEDTDMRDIGAFAYEVESVNAKNDGKPPKKEKYNTKTSAFDSVMFDQYMNYLFNQEVIFKIDVPDGHYLLHMLALEASNDVSAPVIRKIIYDTLDAMTGGGFTKALSDLRKNAPASQDTIFLSRERILNGYYHGETTKNGVVQRINRPLDNLDHLALLNLLYGDARVVQEVEKSQQNGMDELAESHRAMVIAQLADDGYQVKSKGTRLTFNPLFITAMTNAFKASGIFPTTNGYLNNQTTWVRPTYDDLARFAVNPANLSTLQGTGYVTGTGNQVHMPYISGSGSW